MLKSQLIVPMYLLIANTYDRNDKLIIRRRGSANTPLATGKIHAFWCDKCADKMHTYICVHIYIQSLYVYALQRMFTFKVFCRATFSSKPMEKSIFATSKCHEYLLRMTESSHGARARFGDKKDRRIYSSSSIENRIIGARHCDILGGRTIYRSSVLR